ncbi:AAA family ATPase [Filobacillus milosensis]|nr:AAA family ATPase [Filobacillus milosensis]
MTEEVKKEGQVITVCSGKGGVGKTVLAVNLAIALSKKNVDVALIDGEFQFGDVSLAMDLQSTFTMKDVVEEQDRLDEYNITNYLTEHESGVKVLSAPSRPEYAELVSSEVIKKTVQLLKKNFDYVVVDAGHGMDDSTIDFMENADKILAVTTLEVASMKNTKMMVETIHQLQLEKKLELVLNRYNMDSLIKPEEAPSMLRAEEVRYIPNNFKLTSQSMNLGVPVVVSHAKSDVAKGIFKLAQAIIDQESGRPNNKKDSLLGKMFSFSLFSK